ncbi:hypothetical protein H0H93_004796 [Arthromyces matolae]|nr:hypothetical protein H0H93_004796 [Arthromyces matolae]
MLDEWEKNRFKRTSFFALDVIFQIGHNGVSFCGFPSSGHKEFVLLHTNGIHRLKLWFCGCNPNYTEYQQLLDAAWYPSTPLAPQTCATFALLRLFHATNLQGKISGFDFYRSIELLTDATRLMGSEKMPDRLAAFMTMARQWRHLKAAKRSGCGHTNSAIKDSPPGSFAVNCRACPTPGVNLPDGWENQSAEKSWLYALILSQDANFRLKNRLRSSHEKDPSLQPGFAYFVNDEAYLSHLSKYVNDNEISHCVGFAALWLANSKKSKGLRATGVGSVSCARHQFFRPNGTGDLQKGEKYANMDFLFFSTILPFWLPWIILCYDIVCQYSKRFWERESALPDWLRFKEKTQMGWAVPKFHLPPHKPECHGPFSLFYMHGVGRTDGEGVERNWSWLNGAASSTSQMGPGSRHDTLDDFMGFLNFKKTVDYGDSLLRKLIRAVPDSILHYQAFEVFTESLQKEHKREVLEWQREVMEWEKDRSKGRDPYLVEEDNVTVKEIEDKLAEEDRDEVGQGKLLRDVSRSSFLISGLAIEDSQLCLSIDAQKSQQTAGQQKTVERKRIALLKKIQKFHQVQAQLCPGLGVPNYDVPSEDVLLHLPSSLSLDQRSTIPEFASMEERLREAHAYQALTELRRQLRTRTFSLKFKDNNASSQGSYTRMRALLDQIEAKIRMARVRYNKAREALLKLRGPGVWEDTLKALRTSDIRGVNEATVLSEEAGADERAHALTHGVETDTIHTISTLHLRTGEGSRSVSWIWLGVTASEMNADLDGSLHDGIRLEWLKSRARAQRWREEVLLLDEEMRRVLCYTEWRAAWWNERLSMRLETSSSLMEGISAFAAEQSHLEKLRYETLHTMWDPIRKRAREALDTKLKVGTDDLRSLFPRIEVELEEEEDIEADELLWSDEDE